MHEAYRSLLVQVTMSAIGQDFHPDEHCDLMYSAGVPDEDEWAFQGRRAQSSDDDGALDAQRRRCPPQVLQ